MSSPIVLDDVIQVTYLNRLFGQVIETVLHMRCTGAPTGVSAEVQLQDLADTYKDRTMNGFLLNYNTYTSQDLIFDAVRVQRVGAKRTIYFEGAIGIIGTIGTASAPQNSAVSIEKQTTTVGRKGVGRMQLAGFPLAVLSGGNITGTYATQLSSNLCPWLRGSQPGGATYTGSYKACLPAAINGTGAAYDVLNAFPRLQVRTMHRRTVGLGI